MVTTTWMSPEERTAGIILADSWRFAREEMTREKWQPEIIMTAAAARS